MRKRCIKCHRWFKNESDYKKHDCVKKSVKEAQKLGMSKEEGEKWATSFIVKKLKNGKK